jgi:hypothetical protein
MVVERSYHSPVCVGTIRNCDGEVENRLAYYVGIKLDPFFSLKKKGSPRGGGGDKKKRKRT